ncbi:hypothetical protein AMEX_G3837 [Scomber scombrus]|uniref:Integrase catalytic domain-containing protein n=1 Tax=Scomber scombrus TaxID=13677 RepID=A0AAV1Q9H2_SCOSC
MTDLYTKWVTAEPLRCKSASEVSAAIVGKMYTFSMVRKIITDQGKEFVIEDERTNQNIKRALKKYVNENHDYWDLHLPAVVYGINTALQASTRHTPYFLMFNRHPHLPEILNACPMGDAFEVGDPEEGIDTIVTEMRAFLATLKVNKQDKRKSVRVCSINVGDDVLISDIPNKRCRKETLASHHQGPFTVASISTNGLATVVKDNGRWQQLNVSRLRPYYRLESKGLT